MLAWVGSLLKRRRTPQHSARSALRPALVVTGASGGIGAALAQRFAQSGHYAVVLVGRQSAALAATASLLGTTTQVHCVELDLTAHDALEALDQFLARQALYLEVLINCAGVGLSGPFHEQDPAAIDALLAININALTRLMRSALPSMLARGRGGILNVASLGGFVPGPHQAAYYGSKAFVISLTEAVASEVKGQGVRVAVLAPGPVNTLFHAKMGAESAMYRHLIPGRNVQSVARSAYRGFQLGHTVIVPGLLENAIQVSLWLVPHAITVRVVKLLLKPATFKHRSESPAE